MYSLEVWTSNVLLRSVQSNPILRTECNFSFSNMRDNMQESPYSLPEIYEIAFSFRDYPKSVDFICEAATAAGLDSINSMIELGCGPGQYCLEFARRGISAVGLDSSPEMIAYVGRKAESEKIPCRAIEEDFTSFTLAEPVDLAVCMMETFEHNLTNRDAVANLTAVADNLTENGLFLIELSHPRDFLTSYQSANSKWTMERDGIKVDTDWAAVGEPDPLTETTDIKVTYTVTENEKTQVYCTPSKMRNYTAGLIRALVDLSGRFKIATMYGDLDMNRPFDMHKNSWRMILVLRKYA